MSVSRTWPGGGTSVSPASFSIPEATELNWADLTDFLVALADSAQSTTFQKDAIRVATATPVTVSAASDCIICTDLSVAGAAAVNLPAGANKQVFVVTDGKGDAKTNNITITPNGAETINGSATFIMSHDSQAVMLCYNAGDTDWKIVYNSIPTPGTITGVLPIANGGTNSSASLNNSRVMVSSGGAIVESADITTTELGYLNGVTGTTGTGNLVLSASPTISGELLLQNAAGSQPQLSLSEDPDNGTNKVTIQAPATLGSDYTLTLPTDDGDSGEVLTTNGSGVLSWEAALTNPMDSDGDMIYGGASGVPTKLDAGAAGQFLKSNGATAPAWTTVTYAPAIASSVNNVSSADYTILDNDGYSTILVSTGASQRTITLPTVADNTGRPITIKKTDSGAGTVLIDGEGSETIDQATSRTLTSRYSWITIISNGTEWQVTAVGADNIASASSSFSNIGSTGQWADAGSITLQPGLWSITGIVTLRLNGATITSWDMGIGTVSGNSATGVVAGNTKGDPGTSKPDASNDMSLNVPSSPTRVTTSTTYYLKVRASYITATPTYAYRISALLMG